MKSNQIPEFKDKKLFQLAFIHRSYLNEHKDKKLESNERLEFLGDAVLELIVSLYLFKKFPNYPEGKLTSLRSKLVQTTTLSLVAKKLGFGKKLKLSKGEIASGGAKNKSILADTFEAFVGALYQDQGFEKSYDFVYKNLLLVTENMPLDELPQDYKSKLQELIQSQGQPSPKYEVIKSYGPDHNKTFITAVIIDNKTYETGVGKSKQDAEQNAAKKALEKKV